MAGFSAITAEAPTKEPPVVSPPATRIPVTVLDMPPPPTISQHTVEKRLLRFLDHWRRQRA